MHRIDGAGATVDNKFTEGDPVGGIQATVVTDNWLNDVQEELISVLVAGGVAPVKGTQNQVLQAIRSLSAGAIGSARNVNMSVATASASATLTAGQIIVGASLSGQAYRLASFNKTINLSTTGVGGMDIGTAPVSGYVAIYAIYNPATGVSALLAVNATSVKAGEVYGGANMPSGYTASALVAVWPTNASSQFIVGYLDGDRRELYIGRTVAFSSSTAQSALTSVSISSKVPLNAKEVFGDISGSTTGGSSASIVLGISADANGTGQIYPTSLQYVQVGYKIPMIVAQTAYYLAVTSAGTLSYQINVSGYTF